MKEPFNLSYSQWFEPVQPASLQKSRTYTVEYRHWSTHGWKAVKELNTVVFEKTGGFYIKGDTVVFAPEGWVYESDAAHWTELRSRVNPDAFYRVVTRTGRVFRGYQNGREICIREGSDMNTQKVWCETRCNYVTTPCHDHGCTCQPDPRRQYDQMPGEETMREDLKVNVNREKLIETLKQRKNELESDTSLPDAVQKLVDEMKAAAEKIEGGEEVSTDKDCGPLKEFWLAWETLRHDPYFAQEKQRRKQQVTKIERYLKIFGISDDESIEIAGDDDLYTLL